MRFEEPKLDNRNFQEIVDELKRRIPLYCPEWTDHNVSDPGVTLIELFGYVAEQLLYSMNQVPALHYMKFAQFLGIPLPVPQPARVDVNFLVDKRTAEKYPNDVGLRVDAGAKVSTTQTETQEPYVFTTEHLATIMAPQLSAVIRHQRGSSPKWLSLETLKEPTGVEDLFSEQPVVRDAFYFEFENDLSHHIICLEMDFDTAVATNINPSSPPIRWEAYTDKHNWEPIPFIDDSTRGLNSPGKVELHLPRLTRRAWSAEDESISNNAEYRARYSIRVLVVQAGYDAAPRLKQLMEVATLGRTVEAVHTEVVRNEYLGESNGLPGQRFELARGPIVLPLHADEGLKVVPPNGTIDDLGETWLHQEHFLYPEPDRRSAIGSPSGSGINGFNSESGNVNNSNRKVFTIDSTTNQIRLPPAIQTAQGNVVQYGDVPERGSHLYMTSYRYSGSTANVPRGAINVLKTSIPYIKGVENRSPAIGGQDAPSLAAMEAAVQMFMQYYTRNNGTKAVNAIDYVSMVLNRFGEHITKVEWRTEETQRTMVHLFVVGNLSFSTLASSHHNPAVLQVSDDIIEEIERYLYDYRLLTDHPSAKADTQQIHINVTNPHYVRVNVLVRASAPTITGQRLKEQWLGDQRLDEQRLDGHRTAEQMIISQNEELLRNRLEEAIIAYLHPVTGGPTGRGWALGSIVTSDSIEWWLDSIREELIRREPYLEIQELNVEHENVNLARPEPFNANYAMLLPGRCEVEFNA